MKTKRLSAYKRGYNKEWRRIRAEVLTAHNIPRNKWHLYAVDHNPPFNPSIEPDHRKYTLIPMLIADHNRKTAKYDGGFGNPKKKHTYVTRDGRIIETESPYGEGVLKSLQPKSRNPVVQVRLSDVKKDIRGSRRG